MSANVVSQSRPPARAAEPEPYFGTRFVRRVGPDGSEILEQIPMTLEDLLHPEESDEIPMRALHQEECAYLKYGMQERYPPEGGYTITSDWRIDWGVPGVRPHQPDIGAFGAVVQQPDPRKGTFDLVASGGRCLLTVELVSPDSRKNDVVDKFNEYHQVGVPLYIIVDEEREFGPRRILAYRHTPSRYVEVPLDARGRVRLGPLNLDLGLEDGRVVLYDSATGERIADYTEVVKLQEAANAALQVAEAARQAAEEKVQELEAEMRRLKGGPPTNGD